MEIIVEFIFEIFGFINGILSSFIQNLPSGMRVEGMRYLIGAGGTFLLIWVILGGVLAGPIASPAMFWKLYLAALYLKSTTTWLPMDGPTWYSQ